MQADLLLEARSLREGAAVARAQQAEWSSFEAALGSELSAAAGAEAPMPGVAVEQLARVLAALAQSGDRDVAWNSVRLPATASRKTGSIPPGNGASRDVADIFGPLARSPGLVAARISAQGDYRTIAGLGAEISRLCDLSVAVGDIELDGHRISLGLIVLARAP